MLVVVRKKPSEEIDLVVFTHCIPHVHHGMCMFCSTRTYNKKNGISIPGSVPDALYFGGWRCTFAVTASTNVKQAKTISPIWWVVCHTITNIITSKSSGSFLASVYFPTNVMFYWNLSCADVCVHQMNELLNRWRHGEVNLLQRRFRLARTQSVKPTMAAKLRSSLVPPSSGSVTATSVATSNNRDNSVGEDGSTSPLSGEDAEVGGGEQRKQAAEGTLAMLGVNGGGGGIEAAGGELGGGGSSRAGMDKEAFFRVFPEVQVRMLQFNQQSSRHPRGPRYSLVRIVVV